MTRKDYELIARALQAKRDELVESRSGYDRICGHDGAVLALAEALASDNPRFNSARFLAACGTH